MNAGSGVPMSDSLSEEHQLSRNAIFFNPECRSCLCSSWSHCQLWGFYKCLPIKTTQSLCHWVLFKLWPQTAPNLHSLNMHSLFHCLTTQMHKSKSSTWSNHSVTLTCSPGNSQRKKSQVTRYVQVFGRYHVRPMPIKYNGIFKTWLYSNEIGMVY